MLIVHYFNVLSLEHKLHNSKKTRKMNRLAMLPLVIIASCLYSCSPKIGESASGNSNNDVTNYNSSTATNNANTAVQASTSTSATVNNSKEINSKDLQPTQGKIVDFQEK
jgi:hypothetical protein